MFCTQDNQYFSPALPGTQEKIMEILDSPQVKWKIETIRKVRQPEAIKLWGSNTDFQKFCLKEAAKKKTGEAFKELTDEEKLARWANSLKESLPCLIFGARDFDETATKKNPDKPYKHRVLKGIHLSGLFMFDVDHVDNPQEIYERTKQEGFPWEVVFAHKTSSGFGLRLVCKIRREVGNIADNQIELAKALGVKADASCIDASRISYAPMREDVYYLNLKELLNYYDEEFDQKYVEAYRSGRTEATDKKHSFDDTEEGKSEKIKAKSEDEVTLEKNEEGEYTYHGVRFRDICDAWQTSQGGAPVPGDRHRTMLQMALDLRYITDNRPENIVCVLKLCRFVQDVIRERGEEEVRGVADTACERRLYRDIPKRLQAVLESAGVHAGKGESAGRALATAEIPYELFAERLEPLLSTPYSDACRGVERHNWLGAVFAAGAMYCTLLSRCWYLHFNGAKQRMNPQVLIIGDPASGKSFAKELDDQIMCSMRAQDEEVRAAETRYKQEQKKRGT